MTHHTRDPDRWKADRDSLELDRAQTIPKLRALLLEYAIDLQMTTAELLAAVAAAPAANDNEAAKVDLTA